MKPVTNAMLKRAIEGRLNTLTNAANESDELDPGGELSFETLREEIEDILNELS